MLILRHIFRKASLKRNAFRRRPKMLPLEALHSVILVVDASDPALTQVLELSRKFFSHYSVRLEVRIVSWGGEKSLRYLPKGEKVSFSRSDLGLFSLPKSSFIRSLVMADPQGALVNLCRLDSFTFRYLNRVTPAYFKIGVYRDYPFNLTICGDDTLSCLEKILDIMKIVKDE